MRYGNGGRNAVGDDHPQSRLPGPVPRHLSSANSACRRSALAHRRRRILWRRRLPQGRPAGCAGPSPRPSAPPMRRRSARRNSAWASTGLINCAPATVLSASSTASTPTSGTRRPTPHSPNYIGTGRSKARAPTSAAVEERFGLDRDDGPDLLRRQPADLAEGHGLLAATVLDGIWSATGARLAVLGSGDAGARRRAARRRGPPSRPRRRRRRL